MKAVTFDIPEEMLVAIHLYMVAAHGLARGVSRQPPELKGMDMAKIMETAYTEAEAIYRAKPPEEQRRLLNLTAVKLAEVSGAIAVILAPDNNNN